MARRIIKRDEEQQRAGGSGAQTGAQGAGDKKRLPRAQGQKTQVIRLDTATQEVIERACSRAARWQDAEALRSEYRYYHSDGYNEREHKLLQSLGKTGITRTARSQKPLYDMDIDEMWDAMRSMPDKDRRNQAYDTLGTLTKTKGSRFYGYSLPKAESERAYIGTADMPGDEYDKWKKSLDSRFYAGSGHEQENAQAYEQLYNAAITGAANDTQRYWYLAALDDAYEAQTRRQATDPQTMNRRANRPEQEDGQAEAENGTRASGDGETEKPGLIRQAADAVGGMLQRAGEHLADAFAPDGGGEEMQTDARVEALNEQIREADQNADPRRADALAQERAKLIAQMAREAQAQPEQTEPQQEQTQEQPDQPDQPEQTDEAQAKNVPRLGGMLDAGFAAAKENAAAEQPEEQMPAPGTLDLTHDPILAIHTAKTAPETLNEQTRELVNDLATTSTMGKLAYYGTPFLPVEEQLNPQADPGAAERMGYLQGDVSGVIGGTLGGYYARIQHRSFPESLRDDAMAVLYETGMEAEQAARSGAFTYDPDTENLYEAYLLQNPHKLDNLKGVFATLGEMRAQQREQARQAEAQAQLLEDEKDELAREHLRSGQYTQADYDRVYDKAPVVTRADAAGDEGYAAIVQDIAVAVSDSYLEDGGFFNEQTERYLLESGLASGMDSVAAMQYKDVLGGYAEDEAMRDLRVARALGYGSLADYYEKTGSGSVDDLCARAALRMEQFGSSVDEETMAQAEQTAQYEGTGEAGVLDVVSLSAQMGTAQTAGELLEAFWTAQQTTAASMQGIVASNRYEYAQRYSPVMASYAARRDWERAIEVGQLPNEEWAQYARAYLDAGGDPFALGPVHNTKGALSHGAISADKWADSVVKTAQKTLTIGQGKAFEIGSGAVFNTEMQAMSTAITLMTGSGALGMGLSFGLASYAGETREQLAYGPQKRTLAEVNAMGLAHAASDTIANTATSEKLTGKLTSAFGINAAIANGAANGGSAAAAKGMAAMLGAFGKGFARGAADMAVDEVVKDEFKERWLWSVIGTAGNAALDGATIVEAAGKALEAANPAATAAGVIADAPDNLVAMLPMIFMGGMGDGVSDALVHFPRTRRAAQRVSETGDAQDAKAFVQEMNAEIASPEAKEELSDAMRAAAVGQKAAVELVTDPALREQAQKAQKTQEQADAHQATVQAESARREAAAQAMRAAEESGDVDAELAAADEAVKAAHNIAEAQREAEQKALEAGTQATEAVSEAIRRGEAEYEKEREAVVRAVSNSEAIQDFRFDRDEAGFLDAVERGDMAQMEAYDERMDADIPVKDAEATGIRAETDTATGSDTATDDNGKEWTGEKLTSPVMQKRASDLYKKTGLTLVIAPLKDGTRGYYDRKNGRIVVSSKLGSGEMNRIIILHELTHFLENTKDYRSFSNAVLDAAYGKDFDAFSRDLVELEERYEEAGIVSFDADKELTAAALEKIIDADDMFIEELLSGKKPGIVARVYAKLKHFLARRRAAAQGKDALRQYDLIQRAHDRLKRAIRDTPKWKPEQYGAEIERRPSIPVTAEASPEDSEGLPKKPQNSTSSRESVPDSQPVTSSDNVPQSGTEVNIYSMPDSVQYALGWTKAGERVVRIEEDILDGVDPKDWGKTVKDALKEKFPNGITVGNRQIQITKKSRKEIVNAHDSMWLKSNQPDVYADKLRAAGNAGEIVQASNDYVNEGVNHERKDDIVDFARGKVNIEVGGQMYSAEVVVGTRENGEMLLYDFVRMTKKEMQRTGERENAPHSSHAAPLSDSSIAQNAEAVNTKDMPDSVQYALDTQHYDYAKPFAQQVEDWTEGRIPKQDSLLVGRTPEVFRKIGLSDVPMTIDQRHMDYIVNGTKDEDHAMSMELIRKLPELIENPVAIIQSETRPDDSIVAIVDATINGKRMIAPIAIQKTARSNGLIIDANHLSSAYGKDSATRLLESAIQKENAGGAGVYYLDKNRASNLIDAAGLQLPRVADQDGLIHSIFDAGSPVNRKYLEQTETRQFKRWFGKSRVVDEDGKPLIVYHGTDAAFDAFRETDGAYWFSKNEDYAEAMMQERSGNRMIQAYLKMENPYRAKLKPGQFTDPNYERPIIRKAKAGGYDGVILEADTENPIEADTFYVVFQNTQIKSATDNVGLFDPQNANIRYAIAPRQFGNKTAQKSDYFFDEVKQRLAGSSYETDSNDAQIRRAVSRIERDGLDATVDYLLDIPQGRFTADDNVLLMAAAVQAGRNDDVTLQWKLAERMDIEGTEAARELQNRKILTKALAPEREIANTVRKADEANAQKGLMEGHVPTGMEAPKRAINGTPEQVKRIYNKAQSTHTLLLEAGNGTSMDNPWGLKLNEMQMELIKRYGLKNVKLPGIQYNRATLKQRMLSAILATPNNVRGDGLLTLCQQLEFMKEGYAVVTEADLNYIAAQMSEALAGGMDEAGQPISQAARDAMGRMYDAQANIRQKNLKDKLTTFAYASMLSGTATWARNIASNVLVTPLENISRDIATAVDVGVSHWTGTRTTAIPTQEERKAGRAAFAAEIANTVRDYYVTHTDTGHGRKYDMTGGNGRVFQNEWLEAYRNIVDFAMQIGDRPFFEKCYAEEKAVIERIGMRVKAAKGEESDSKGLRPMTAEEIHREATARALERVFQEDMAIVNWVNSAPPGVQTVVRTIVPFVKTPTNIANRMFQYSPAGLVKSILVDGLYKGNIHNMKDFDQRKFVMGVGRGLTGLGVIAAGAALGAGGIMLAGYGDEKDERRRSVLKALGVPYGWYIKLGEKMWAIDWALPSATGMILGASMAQRVGNGEDAWSVVLGMFSDLGNELFNNTMLKSVNDLFRGYDDATGPITRAASTFAESKMSQTLSISFVRQIARATDPYVRDTSDSNPAIQAFKENVIQYWPVLRQMLPIRTDMTGDKMLQSGYWNPGKETGNAVMQFVDTFLSPTATIGLKNDEALIELLDMSYRTGESSFLPEAELIASKNNTAKFTKKMAKALGEDAAFDVELTDDERRMANELYSRVLFGGTGRAMYRDVKGGVHRIDGLRSLIESPAYAAMDDEERMEEVNKMKAQAKSLVMTYLYDTLEGM